MKKRTILILLLPLFFGCTEPAKEQSKETTQSHPQNTTEGAKPGGTEPSATEPQEVTHSPSAQVMNNVPVIVSANVESIPPGGMQMNVTAEDKDEDPVSLLYLWTVNGVDVSTEQSVTGLKKGDHVVASVTPYDGKQKGNASSFVITVSNSPPQIMPAQPKYDDPNWSLQVQAKDIDGDPLQYSLTKAPKGMTVDSKTGLISWNTTNVAGGKYDGTVQVSDGQGGTSDYSFTVTLSAQKPEASTE